MKIYVHACCFWLTVNRHDHSEKRRGVMSEFDLVGYVAVVWGDLARKGCQNFYNFSSSSSCYVQPNYVICLLLSRVGPFGTKEHSGAYVLSQTAFRVLSSTLRCIINVFCMLGVCNEVRTFRFE